jgi:AbrB family looped-hinge helix DNA binding protein
MTSTISAKGQITVPKAVRDKLGLRPGARVEFELTAEGVLLRKGHRGGVRAVDRVLASCRTSWLALTRSREPMRC